MDNTFSYNSFERPFALGNYTLSVVYNVRQEWNQFAKWTENLAQWKDRITSLVSDLSDETWTYSVAFDIEIASGTETMIFTKIPTI